MMASPLPAPSSGSSSPAMSELRLNNAPKSIDDLTVALQNFAGTRSSSPDISSLECCCQKATCAHLTAWKNVKAKLESRLVLSAEVGQALLQRYEAYAKRQDTVLSRQVSVASLDAPTFENPQQHIESLTSRLATLAEENSIMESRIQELIIKTELSDATTRALQEELHDARTNVNKLTAQQSRSTGWEIRLSQLTQERDDVRQERDAAVGRARSAEMRARANADNAGNLQREVNALREELAALRASRTDFSQAVLEEAKSRLEILRRSLNVSDSFTHAQTARILETLVADNEALKKDVSELNMLLDEARDELSEAREKWDEETRVHTFDDTLDFGMRYPQDKSVQTDSLLPSNSNHLSHPHTTFALPSPRPSVLAVESIGSSHSDTSSILQPDKDKPLNGAVSSQFSHDHSSNVPPRPLGTGSTSNPNTNATTPLSPGQAPSQIGTNNFSAHDSEPITLLTNALSSILTRLLQCDARTLTLRLRKQHVLSGAADPRSVSQATIKNILNDVAALKLGRDSGLKWKVTRGEVKAILRLFKQIFELACAMRVTLNEVIFEPSIAHRLKKEALATDNNNNNANGSDAATGNASFSSGWIQRLFGQSGLTTLTASSSSGSGTAGGHFASSSASNSAELRHPVPQRPSAKLAPAIGASSMTVSVVGPDARHGLVSADDVLRAASPPSALSRAAGVISPSNGPAGTGTGGAAAPMVHAPTPRSLSLMGIFAGAPIPNPDERWVVLPRIKPDDSDVKASGSNKDRDTRDVALNQEKEKEKREYPDKFRQLRGAFSNISLGRSAAASLVYGSGSGKPRAYTSAQQAQVPPYLGVNTHDHPHSSHRSTEFQEPLLQRTLRPRGLSDSSIRTTFLKGEVQQQSPLDNEDLEEDIGTPGPLNNNNKNSTNGRRHQHQQHQLPTTFVSPSSMTPTPASSFTASPPRAIPMQRPSSARPGGMRNSFVPSSWVESGVLNGMRDDSPIHNATWARRAVEGRDY